ncbi:hypothetical protein [Aquabacterium sp.]|uniref:hypothetical protein n=1 Tax=Aquabacterium sp. TaxID=1872578 RepID=UPI0037850EC1
MLRPLAALCAAGSAVLGTGCASIVNGQNQSLSVQAISGGKPVQGASCTLMNDKGTWYLTTPGSAVVHRSFAELSVKCEKTDYEPGLSSVKSSTKAMAFGNILFGGVIGATIDVSSGAAYDYPNEISVVMAAVAPGAAGAAAAAQPAAAQPAAAAVQAPPASGPAAQVARSEYLVYRITDRLTQLERRVRVAAGSKMPAGTGDMELLSPPGGWVPAVAEAGASWNVKYAARDANPGSQVSLSGKAGMPGALRTAAGEFEAVPITYKGWIDRVANNVVVAQPAEFRVWMEPRSRRVLRFESSVPFRSAGPNQARASEEQVELVKLSDGTDDETL